MGGYWDRKDERVRVRRVGHPSQLFGEWQNTSDDCVMINSRFWPEIHCLAVFIMAPPCLLVQLFRAILVEAVPGGHHELA